MNIFSPHMKLQWAKKHLDLLASEITIFRATKTCTVSAKEDLDNGLYVVRMKFPADDSSAVLIAGDFIHALRCALDHLAWQLALLSGHTPTRDIHFPIYGVDGIDTQVKITKATIGVPDGAIFVMKAFQPYKSGDSYKLTHLWRLNELWNIDKHRHLAPHGIVSGLAAKINTPPGEKFPVESEQFDDGIAMKVPLALKDHVQFDPNPTVDIYVGDKKEGIELRLEDLIEMYKFVAETVFPSFASFFQQPDP
jgi:hypothetical protein